MRDYDLEQAILETMKDLAVQAGNIIMDIYNTDFEVDYKADASPVTEADKKADAYIVQGLKQYTPQMAILSEEGKDNLERREHDYCFIVDPLDGTKEFVKRNGQFTVNIALAYQQRPVLGVICVPVTKVLYFGSKDGAYCLEDGQPPKRLHVSDKLSALTWVGSKSHSGEKEQSMIAAHEDVIANVISAGSSLKGCLVAEQKADVYYRFGLTCEWDTAAMHAIAEAAGAVVRQMDNSELLYNRENTLNEKGFFIVNRPENVWI
jgi:3'(2'), 5'-bisphosphate nucleotidase